MSKEVESKEEKPKICKLCIILGGVLISLAIIGVAAIIQWIVIAVR